jgi:uncharacterized protein YgbK (DUF1537 family)
MAEQALLFGAIADDDTGASDEAGMLSEAGARTILSIGIPTAQDLACWKERYHAVVVATKTRAASSEEAYRITRQAVAALAAGGTAFLQVKYCSTFDSTERGNIGPSLDAALDELGERFTIAVPALPVNGRTTYLGHHFVNGALLSDSPMRQHPLTPMTDANLVRWLARQTARNVGLVELAAVRAGESAVQSAFERLKSAGVQIAVVDCTAQEDLGVIARASAGMRLTSGGSGLAMELPAAWRNSGRLARVSWEGNQSIGKGLSGCLMVAGSCSEATLRQNRLAAESGIPQFALDPLELIAGRFDRAPIAERLRSGEAVLLSTTADADEIARTRAAAVRRGMTAEALGERIAGATARLTADLIAETGASRLIVAGGETSGHVCRELGIRSLEICGNIDPGVPLCRSGSMLLALKSGNFGAPDFYRKALDRMNSGGAGSAPGPDPRDMSGSAPGERFAPNAI